MAKTYTPVLDPEALTRLDAYATRFRDAFAADRPALWCPVYLRGLIQDGERKSIEPLSRRVPLPPELQVKDPEQALQQFVSQSPWDEQVVWRRYRAVMAEAFADPGGIFVVDDTQAGPALRRRPASALRRPGQEGQLPVRRLGPLRRPRGPLPARHAAVPARV